MTIDSFDTPSAPVPQISLVDAPRKRARERADLAAAWVRGDVTLKRTVINAAQVFGVSRPYIVATANTRRTTSADTLARAWDRASAAQRGAS